MVILQSLTLPDIGVGTFTAILIGVLSYLGKRSIDKNDERIKDLENYVHVEIEKIKIKQDNSDEKINKVNLAILEELKNMSVKLAEYKH